MELSRSPLWLLTGTRGAGKTTFCRLVAGFARQDGWQVAGLLSPPVFTRRLKTGILVQDLRTGQSRPLASLVEKPPFSLALGDWFFDPQALAFGRDILATALPCDLLIVDEIGPLEILRGAGWSNALTVLGRSACRLALAVVRPELQALAARKLPVHAVLPLEPNPSIEQLARDWWQENGREHGS